MTTTKKNEIIDNIMALIIELTDGEVQNNKTKPVEMLTIKECTQVVKGLTENTIHQMVAQNKVKHIRTGQRKRGKILVNKEDLLRIFEV